MQTAFIPAYVLALLIATQPALGQATSNGSMAKGGVTTNSLSTRLAIMPPNDSAGSRAEPVVALTVENLTNIEIPFPDVRLVVTSEGKEAATTLLQRQVTHRLKPGEAEVREGGYEPGISPGKTFTRKYKLSDFYELSNPGIYKVSIRSAEEVMLMNGKWVVADKLHWILSNEVEIPIR